MSPCVLFGWAVAAVQRKDPGGWTSPHCGLGWVMFLGQPECQPLHSDLAVRLLGATVILALTPWFPCSASRGGGRGQPH